MDFHTERDLEAERAERGMLSMRAAPYSRQSAFQDCCLYKRNRELLKGLIPDSPSGMERGPEFDDIAVSPARSGAPTLRFLPAGGRATHVHSAYDPGREAAALAEAVPLCHDSIVIVYGMGLLYHVKALLNRASPKCKIILIEPDWRVFETALGAADFAGVLPSARVSFSLAATESELASFLRKEITPANYMLVSAMALPAYKARYEKEYAAFERVRKETLARRGVENATICSQSVPWLENTVRNMAHLPQSFRHWSFEGLFRGKPGVVVSSGPSLDKNVKLLSRLKGKALIVAAYSALRGLKKHGITPDIAVAIDRWQTLFHEDGSSGPLAVPLLYISSTDFRLLNKTSAQKIFAPTADDRYITGLYSRLGHEEGLLFSSGSVAIAAADFAATAGCDPIIFVGQDFAFTGDKLHCDNVDTQEEIDSIQKAELASSYPTADVYGGKVLTNSVMDMYRHTLEDYISHDAGRRYIDATEGGALIAGTDVLALGEAIERTNAGEMPGGISEMLGAHFSNGANRTFGAEHAAEFLRLYAGAVREICASPEYGALSRYFSPEGEDDGGMSAEEAASAMERVFALAEKHDRVFHMGKRYAYNIYAKNHMGEYMKQAQGEDAQGAYRRYLVKQFRILQYLREIAQDRLKRDLPWIEKVDWEGGL